MFEAAEQAGGHANTVRVGDRDRAYDVDTGFIVFNDRNYPSFERLLDELAVATQPSPMSFGVSDGVRLRVQRRLAERPVREPSPICSAPAFHRMIADLARFNRDARALLASDENRSSSLRELAASGSATRVRSSSG